MSPRILGSVILIVSLNRFSTSEDRHQGAVPPAQRREDAITEWQFDGETLHDTDIFGHSDGVTIIS